MEITKSLQDDIVKIQNELITAIQNHQVLVLRQQVNPSESIKTQIEEVQRHIICLGESQKILVTRLRSELDPHSVRVNNKHNSSVHPPTHFKHSSEKERLNSKPKPQDASRSLLNNNVNNRGRPFLKTKSASDGDNICERKNFLPTEWPPSVDSSSEENRTPCESPINEKSDSDQRNVKRPLIEAHCPSAKRTKSTLQVSPRPSSPVPTRTKAADASSSSSEESLDSLIAQQPLSESKRNFAMALGLITNDVYKRVIKKKSERRRRRVNSQHHLYNNLWDLTVLQKRSRLKEHVEDTDDASRDCGTPSDSDNLCFVCRKPGDLKECKVCQTGCHASCITTDVCPACTCQASPTPSSPLIAEADRHSKPTFSERK